MPYFFLTQIPGKLVFLFHQDVVQRMGSSIMKQRVLPLANRNKTWWIEQTHRLFILQSDIKGSRRSETRTGVAIIAAQRAKKFSLLMNAQQVVATILDRPSFFQGQSSSCNTWRRVSKYLYMRGLLTPACWASKSITLHAPHVPAHHRAHRVQTPLRCHEWSAPE